MEGILGYVDLTKLVYVIEEPKYISFKKNDEFLDLKTIDVFFESELPILGKLLLNYDDLPVARVADPPKEIPPILIKDDYDYARFLIVNYGKNISTFMEYQLQDFFTNRLKSAADPLDFPQRSFKTKEDLYTGLIRYNLDVTRDPKEKYKMTKLLFSEALKNNLMRDPLTQNEINFVYINLYEKNVIFNNETQIYKLEENSFLKKCNMDDYLKKSLFENRGTNLERRILYNLCFNENINLLTPYAVYDPIMDDSSLLLYILTNLDSKIVDLNIPARNSVYLLER